MIFHIADRAFDPAMRVFDIHDFFQWPAQTGEVLKLTLLLSRADPVFGDSMPGSVELLERCHEYLPLVRRGGKITNSLNCRA